MPALPGGGSLRCFRCQTPADDRDRDPRHRSVAQAQQDRQAVVHRLVPNTQDVRPPQDRRGSRGQISGVDRGTIDMTIAEDMFDHVAQKLLSPLTPVSPLSE